MTLKKVDRGDKVGYIGRKKREGREEGNMHTRELTKGEKNVRPAHRSNPTIRTGEAPTSIVMAEQKRSSGKKLEKRERMKKVADELAEAEREKKKRTQRAVSRGGQE